ncbi:peptidoglycan-binding protein [Amycolatopsis panacis]|uniref:Peptidoglycan-binding protein n=1 Tax=Amycolatopsis panacis TaxID=2340917 RepID=A0A419I9Q8_9PSEU|nr:peptidoglycan-binding protein [Amycolatopsis panacis]RJQ89644.1 peptidoglycan-binding protein [Amycolatopsis panacis]
MRKWLPAVVAGILVLVTAGVIVFTWTHRAEPDAPAGPGAPRTVAVTTEDLSDIKTFTGKLGFGPEQPVEGRKSGTLTWLPAPGAGIGRGEPVYKVDNVPVPLFYGETPLWRKLDTLGTTGPDVRIVKRNLAALGHSPGVQDDVLTPRTQDAIKRWQKARKLDQTGIIDVGDVLVLPGRIRVGGIKAQLGSPATAELMSVTAQGKSVTAMVGAAEVGSVKPGGKVTVLLPNGNRVPGTAGEIGHDAQAPKSQGSGSVGGGQDEAKIPVAVTLDDEGSVGALDSGPVQVQVTASTRKGVLAVPVDALLALREGGYAVQVVQGGGTRQVGVQTGLFSGGLVEIRGAGIAAGTQVVVTS